MDEEVYHVEARLERTLWWFKGRRRILAQLLAGLDPPLPPRPRVLDVGCGTGANEVVLARPGGFLLSADAERIPLRLFSSRRLASGAALCCDAAALPLADGVVDLVVALDVLEHLDDDAAALRELARVCRPGGAVVLFVPALQLLWGSQDVIAHHRRRYGAGQLAALVAGAGLELRRQTFFNSLMFLPILAYRLAWRALGRGARVNENELVGPLTNALLDRLFALEAPLLRRLDLPLGVSLAAVANRPISVGLEEAPRPR